MVSSRAIGSNLHLNCKPRSTRQRLQAAAVALTASFAFLFGGAILLNVTAPAASAQSLLAGDILGTVLDPQGSAVPNATVKATSKENGSTATATTNATGGYRFSLLKPGNYVLTAGATGFKESSVTVVVSVGQQLTQTLQLTVGAGTETVEVSATGEMLQTDSADLSTQFNLEQLQSVPNPGGDITYVAQTAPGVVMNTTGDYGNFSAFGLPGTSNNFTMNGMQVNDPFLNLNNSGPSNLLLGLNDVEEVNVVTNAYGTQFGSFGGAQVNAISRSGSNGFHGNANYWWNGRSLNANDYFFNQGTPITPRPFANTNQWAAAVGGPVKKDKTFFFVNYEGLSFITSGQAPLELPSASYEAATLGNDGQCDNSTSTLFEAGFGAAGADTGDVSRRLGGRSLRPHPRQSDGSANECPYYTHIFSIYNGTPNYSSGTDQGNGEVSLSAPTKISLTEKLINGRVDQVFGEKDKAFIHFKYDHGIQPTDNDPINTAFNATSNQPDYEGQLSETHTFGSKAVNQFLLTGSWYSALFLNSDPAKEAAALPFEMEFLDGEFTTLNNNGLAWPEGRNVTQYQVGDDFSYNLGKHTLKAGVAFKKDDVSDHDTGVLTVPLVLVDSANFQAGQADLGIQNTSQSLDLPISLYTLGFYFQDDWKPMSNLTINAGIRLERNSNPDCPKNCLSNFGGDFFTLAQSAPLNSPSGAYNAQIKSGLAKTFTNYQAFMLEPRVGFTWSPSNDSKTVVRGGFGIFTDVFPATIADSMLSNPPLTTSFTIAGSAFGGGLLTIDPSFSTSTPAVVAATNATFESSFATGGSFTSDLKANPNYAAPNMTTVSDHLKYPTYDEWNLQIQRALSKWDVIEIGYVGNRGYHEPVENQGVNAVLGAYGLPGAPPAPSFASVNQIESAAVSSYHGLIVSYRHSSHGFTGQLNYALSHNLDEISNGGILPFAPGAIAIQINPYNLGQNYGNSDYDVRHYMSGNYLYQLKYFGGPKVLTDGWQISGTIFARSGLPFTPSELISDWGIGNYDQGSGSAPIASLPGINHHCGSSSAVKSCFTAADFPNYVDPTTLALTTSVSPFGAVDRNQFYGPHYFDTDMTIVKSFKLPFLGDAGKINLGATAFNLFNHPSFANPNASIDNIGAQLPRGSSFTSVFGSSLTAVGPPTSIYGAFLGGDDSVRIIQFTGKIIF
jgi:hypothetical protein